MDKATCAANNTGGSAPYIKKDGTCVARCPDFLAPNASTNKCESKGCKDVADTTTPWTEFDGTCSTTCSKFGKNNTDSSTNTDKKCIRDDCSSTNGFLKEDGTCAANAAACPPYYNAKAAVTGNSPDVAKCVPVTCADPKYLTYDGICVDDGTKCPQNSRADLTQTNNLKKCYRNTCTTGALWWDLTGNCVASCASVEKSYADETDGNKRCKRDKCTVLEVL
jgi:hypothetical protein